MEEKSRTEHSVQNTTTAIIAKMIALLTGFITRVVFTHCLSQTYVGINGLFWDILNVFSLSEFGVGTAITYALYEPVAKGDVEKQKSLMQLYRKIYHIMGGFVLAAGLAVIPFMDFLVKGYESVDHLIAIYLLYLANSVFSYLLIYKKSMLDAHQLSYLGEISMTVSILVQDALQITVLLTTQNFYLFLCMMLLATIGNNIWISYKADRLYPFLKDKDIKPIPKEEQSGIYQNIRAMLMHKVGDVLVNNTDNLILSAMVGLISVGCYSNYYLIIASVHSIMTRMFQGLTASVGNLGVTQGKERIRKVFASSFFVGQWMYGFAAICLYELINLFVEFSFGAEYVFPENVVFVLCLNFFILGMRQAALVFRDSLGLFWFDRYKSIANALLNIVFSIVLAKECGAFGVFLGTLFSTLLTSFWVEPLILYRHSLKVPVVHYFAKYALYTGIVFAAGVLTHISCRQMGGSMAEIFFKRICVCVVVPNIIFLVCYVRTKEFCFLWEKIMSLIKKRRKTS